MHLNKYDVVEKRVNSNTLHEISMFEIVFFLLSLLSFGFIWVNNNKKIKPKQINEECFFMCIDDMETQIFNV